MSTNSFAFDEIGISNQLINCVVQLTIALFELSTMFLLSICCVSIISAIPLLIGTNMFNRLICCLSISCPLDLLIAGYDLKMDK